MVPAGSSPEDNTCPICHEEFDQFYKQDFADISSSEGKIDYNNINGKIIQVFNVLINIVKFLSSEPFISCRC